MGCGVPFADRLLTMFMVAAVHAYHEGCDVDGFVAVLTFLTVRAPERS